MEFNLNLIPYIEINSTWIINLNVKLKTIHFLASIEEHLQNIGITKEFLVLTKGTIQKLAPCWIGSNQIKKCFLGKCSHGKDKKASYELRENIHSLYIWQGLDSEHTKNSWYPAVKRKHLENGQKLKRKKRKNTTVRFPSVFSKKREEKK